MKKALFFYVLTLLSTSLFAQDATLTKGETVKYLSKKFEECENLYTNGFILKNARLSLNGDKLTISYSEYDKTYNRLNFLKEWEFNPIDIKSFEFLNLNEPVTFLRIKLTSKSAKTTITGTSYSSSSDEGVKTNSYIIFYFLTKDGSNENKVKKAFLHLQALLKAEDDPFGE